MRPDRETNEFEIATLHPGVTRERVREQTGWNVRFRDHLEETAPPTPLELDTLRDLLRRTEQAHSRKEVGDRRTESL
jgi:glutaconate CoA-transferase, subunit B